MTRALVRWMFPVASVVLAATAAFAQDEPGAPAPPPGPVAALAPAARSPSPPPTPVDAGSSRRGATILQPPSRYWLPPESGALDTRVDFQLGSNVGFHLVNEDSGHYGTQHIVLLALRGQYAIADRLQLGITLPFLANDGALIGPGGVGSFDTGFGDLALHLKVKLAGQSRGAWSVSGFVNSYLPTGSGEPSREWAVIQIGAAGSVAVSVATLGISLSSLWFAVGNGEPDGVLLVADFRSAFRLGRFFAALGGFELTFPVAVSGDSPFSRRLDEPAILFFSPALQFFPTSHLHVDLGFRVALTEFHYTLATPRSVGWLYLSFALGYCF